jgi:protein phosphatase
MGRSLATAHLDIASWTSTGMVRTGNEDAFALIHAASSRQDDMGECALVLLADGMGGYEAGEVAAALAIDSLRQQLLKSSFFAGLTQDTTGARKEFNVKECQEALRNALKEANREVFTASRTPGKGRPGMGCTAEVVYVDGRRLVVGHVGDSRTYHFSNGTLTQLTRDQTLVNRLVELGQLTPEQAEHHERKNELQQAVGGRPVIDPAVYHAELKAGDWVIVCSDGLTNHVDAETLNFDMIQRADSAEMLARRLVNLVNLRGATDNCTVVVVRAT